MHQPKHSLILEWHRLWATPNQIKFIYAPVYCSCAIVNHWSDMRSHDSQNWFDDTINNIDCEARLDRWCQHFAQIRSTRCLLCQFHSEPKKNKNLLDNICKPSTKFPYSLPYVHFGRDGLMAEENPFEIGKFIYRWHHIRYLSLISATSWNNDKKYNL